MRGRGRKFGDRLPLVLIGSLLGAISALGYFKLLPTPIFEKPSFAAPKLNSATGAKTIVGRASVIDGDSIEIQGTQIRLYGIDAPEGAQTCLREGVPTRCGQHAAKALADKIASHTVTCEPKDRDRYNRIVAVCRAEGEDLNAWMVAEGWALAYRQYSTDYIAEEERAKKSKRGIWVGEFIPPWEWRSQTPRALPPSFRTAPPSGTPSTNAPTEGARSGQCDIKGNISQSGERIYHVPGGKFYNQTIINPAQGERLFCSEAGRRPE